MDEKCNILAVDTSSENSFVCIFSCGKLFKSELSERNTSKEIGVKTEELLQKAELKLKDLSLLVCSAGPGSFTGLRIGMAFLKGISSALNIPLVSVSTLELLKKCFENSDSFKESDLCVPCILSGTGRFYFMTNTPSEADTKEITRILIKLHDKAKRIVLIGSDSHKLKKALEGSVENIICFTPDDTALQMIEYGKTLYEKHGADNMTDGPNYLRESEAERTRQRELYLKELPKYNVVIVGAGPAGLTCGQYCSRAGLKTLIIEKQSTGGQLAIIDKIENYPGTDELSGYELAVKMSDQAEKFGCKTDYADVESVSRIRDQLFEIKCTDGKSYISNAVVIATGTIHKKLGAAGEAELTGHGVSYCATCDGPFFRNKKILVCGGGDSAFQEAVYLSHLTSDLTLCHRRELFRAQQAIVDKLKSTTCKYKLNHQIISINSENNKVSSVTFLDKNSNRTYTEDFDAVFVFVGFSPVSDFIDVEKTNDGYIITNDKMETSVKGIYAIGDVRDKYFRQIVTASSDGAICAHIIRENM